MTETGTETSPARRVYHEGNRPTEQVKLRLSPEAAAALRLGAELRRLSLSEYVTSLVLAQEQADKSKGAQGTPGVSLLEVSRLAHTLHQLPAEVERVRGELGRQGGLLKHLAESTPITARHDAEISATLREMTATAESGASAVAALLEGATQVLPDLERVARILAGRELPEDRKGREERTQPEG